MRLVAAVVGAVLLGTAPTVVRGAAAQEDVWPAWYAGGDSSLPAGVHVIERDSTYSIAGMTAEALQEEMDQKAPVVDGRRVQGAHYWEWWHHYEYSTTAEPGRCRVTYSVVLVRSLIVLPEWEGRYAADPGLLRAWHGYRFRLREHEDGHRVITLNSAEELWEAIAARPPSPCSTIREDVKALADSVFDESAAAQARYDKNTNHGLRQGARWPPGDHE